jgi:hypothetical protein
MIGQHNHCALWRDGVQQGGDIGIKGTVDLKNRLPILLCAACIVAGMRWIHIVPKEVLHGIRGRVDQHHDIDWVFLEEIRGDLCPTIFNLDQGFENPVASIISGHEPQVSGIKIELTNAVLDLLLEPARIHKGRILIRGV